MVLDFGIQENIDQYFVQEASELLQQIHNGILELPYNYTAPKIRHLVRAAQTIKGSATQANLTDIQTLAHRLEKIFRFLSLENTQIDSQLTALLLQANDYLRLLLIAQIQVKPDDTASILAKAEPVFAHLEARFSHKLPAVAVPLQPSHIDVSQLIRTTEVTQALEKLEMILAESEADRLAEQLIKQAEVFLGFGELLKLSEFVAIAQITITTLQKSPQAAQTVGRIALVGWRAAYEGILKKDVHRSINTVNKDTRNIALPRKLKTSQLFVWVTNGTIFTINSNSVEEILVAKADQIIYSQQQWFLHWRGKIIPTYQLSQLLSYENLAPEKTAKPAVNAVQYQDHQPEPILVLKQGEQIFALQPEIESLIAEPELVIQPLESAARLPSYVYGCTTWKDSLLPMIDVAVLLQQTINQTQAVNVTAKLLDSPNTAIVSQEPTILVVDDSNSVRHIVSLALQKVGYKVLQAEDGQEAIAQLQQNSHVQLVVCDVEMPNMNGFEFLSYRLKEPLFAKIPVVMLSSCSTNKHRLLAMQLGATTYFTKPYVEQEFLAALKLIVEQKSYH
ncbi:MAG: response regulator [Aulosira sp. ZfuVER01]|nr:response regulator [Aulosira sp. ZfuVER01]MDZ7998813.1 response regulator [Aulosira sp. DedVER01a]MDZ8055840.1 response regulator [Aulosira sp. ZfuCHP01]